MHKAIFGPLIRQKSDVEVLSFLLLDSHQQCWFRSRQWVKNRGGKLGWLVKQAELKKNDANNGAKKKKGRTDALFCLSSSLFLSLRVFF